MDDIESFGYITLGVPDLERATLYLNQVCRLHLAEQTETTAFLTGDQRHHWFKLEAAERQTLTRLGFKATGPEGIERLSAKLEKAGIAVTAAPGEDGTAGGIRFRDINGLDWEVYEQMTESSRRPAFAYEGLDMLLHAVVHVPDPLGTVSFYEDVLGFRRSDRIGDLVVFLRSGNGYHHSLALARGAETELDHVAIHVHELDDVMRMRAHAMATGTLSDDIVRHAASGSMSVYLEEPTNKLGTEFCTGHMIITDDSYRGRVLVPAASTANLWSDPFPDSTWELDLSRIRGGQGGTAAGKLVSRAPAPAGSSN